ncbi:hypothetical protein KKH18_02555 [bacterium]|nr:hypothetical protein [bacterium]
MRTLLICLLCAGLTFAAFASDDPYADPDWGYSFNDPHYIPDSAPEALQVFYNEMVPMLEARKSAESAYLREYAEALFQASREVPGSLEDGTYHQRKHYNRAARSLRQNCKELRELAHGGSTQALYKEMREIEADFVRLANLSDSR